MTFASFQESGARSLPSESEVRSGSRTFWTVKRAVDILVSLLALPILAVLSLVLLAINPFLNRGPLIFAQRRMGRDQSEFVMYKFRTMVPSTSITRGPADPVEHDRITPLGYWLRRLRLDELPQVVNVLRGDMSVIGPRPDFIEHARDYAETVPSYRERHVVRPGISGYAQVKLGYAEGYELAETKVQMDLYYIRHASWRLEAEILADTIGVICSGSGSK